MYRQRGAESKESLREATDHRLPGSSMDSLTKNKDSYKDLAQYPYYRDKTCGQTS